MGIDQFLSRYRLLGVDTLEKDWCCISTKEIMGNDPVSYIISHFCLWKAAGMLRHLGIWLLSSHVQRYWTDFFFMLISNNIKWCSGKQKTQFTGMPTFQNLEKLIGLSLSNLSNSSLLFWSLLPPVSFPLYDVTNITSWMDGMNIRECQLKLYSRIE